MVVVPDKESIIEKANEISKKIISLMYDEIQHFSCDDSPSEQIYLYSHVLGNLLAKISIALDNYSRINSIQNLTYTKIIEFINEISAEHIELNKGMIDEF